MATQRPQQIDFPGFDIRAEDTVVDVGCGGGDVCLYAGRMGASVIGIDVEPSLIERTTNAMSEVGSGSFRGIVSDANPIPLPDGIASVVVATEVMEHVPDPASFLSELVRIGRPGARYLLSVPDPKSERIMKRIAPTWYWEPPLHVNVFQPDDLDQLLKCAGLEVRSTHSSGFYWSMWWLFRMAVGMGHKYAEPPDHPLLRHWNAVMAELLATSDGLTILSELDDLVPKSQIVIAAKPSRAGLSSVSSFGGPHWMRRQVRRFVRDGDVRIGPFNLHWKVRRVRASQH
jgi:SAM-dependent methyltransferase